MVLSRHPNVLPVFSSFVYESKLLVVSPLMSGGSVLDIMRTAHSEGIEESSIAIIIKQILQGLDYLHKNNHIHRDVKSGNFLIDEDGTVMLGDFGVTAAGERSRLRNTFVGTPCWMAPEVMEQVLYDFKADIWSLGITCLEMANGHAPLAKFPPMKVVKMTLSTEPPTLNREATRHKYSKSFKDFIDCCLQRDPSKRPTCEKLLSHSFVKSSKKKSHLSLLLQNLPPLIDRVRVRIAQKTTPTEPIEILSWDFDLNETREITKGRFTLSVQEPRKKIEEPTLASISASIEVLKKRQDGTIELLQSLSDQLSKYLNIN